MLLWSELENDFMISQQRKSSEWDGARHRPNHSQRGIPSRLRPQPVSVQSSTGMRLGVWPKGSVTASMESPFTMIGMIKHQYKRRSFQTAWQKKVLMKQGFCWRLDCSGNQGDRLLGVVTLKPLLQHPLQEDQLGATSTYGVWRRGCR